MGALSGASFDLSSDCLGKQILTLFTVGALSAASSDLSSDCLGKGDFVVISCFSSFDSRSRQNEIQKVRSRKGPGPRVLFVRVGFAFYRGRIR